MEINRLIVTGCCYSLSLADAMSALFTDCEITSIAPWDIESPEGIEAAQRALAASDVWLRMPLDCDGPLREVGASRSGPVVNVPNLTFAGFHPDLVYATKMDGSLFSGLVDYHSAIALWAWTKGMDATTAEGLFTRGSMTALQYHEYWRPSVDLLKLEFDRSDLDFGAFWSRLKHRGVFMHSTNHPKVDAIALLAKAIAFKLGAPASVWDDPIERYLTDYLSHIVWPVYPFVGEAIGEVGAYRWRIAERQFNTLRSWLDATWDTYGDTPRDGVYCSRFEDGAYDTVLTPMLEGLQLNGTMR